MWVCSWEIEMFPFHCWYRVALPLCLFSVSLDSYMHVKITKSKFAKPWINPRHPRHSDILWLHCRCLAIQCGPPSPPPPLWYIRIDKNKRRTNLSSTRSTWAMLIQAFARARRIYEQIYISIVQFSISYNVFSVCFIHRIFITMAIIMSFPRVSCGCVLYHLASADYRIFVCLYAMHIHAQPSSFILSLFHSLSVSFYVLTFIA